MKSITDVIEKLIEELHERVQSGEFTRKDLEKMCDVLRAMVNAIEMVLLSDKNKAVH